MELSSLGAQPESLDLWDNIPLGRVIAFYRIPTIYKTVFPAGQFPWDNVSHRIVKNHPTNLTIHKPGQMPSTEWER